MKLRTVWMGAALLVLAGSASATHAQTVLAYDGISPLTTFTTTGTTPRTYTGQAFHLGNYVGGPPQITQMRLGLFVNGAQTLPNPRVRVQFWGTFDPAATVATQVFSNPAGGLQTFNLAPITTTGSAILIYTLNFAAPISLPGTTNLGIGINWQSSADGGVNFADDLNLITAMRTPGTAPRPIGTNITTGGNSFFRNASNLTNFNFQANDARTFAGSTQATDGLAFDLRAVPEPTSLALAGLAAAGGLGAWRRRRKEPAEAPTTV